MCRHLFRQSYAAWGYFNDSLRATSVLRDSCCYFAILYLGLSSASNHVCAFSVLQNRQTGEIWIHMSSTQRGNAWTDTWRDSNIQRSSKYSPFLMRIELYMRSKVPDLARIIPNGDIAQACLCVNASIVINVPSRAGPPSRVISSLHLIVKQCTRSRRVSRVPVPALWESCLAQERDLAGQSAVS